MLRLYVSYPGALKFLPDTLAIIVIAELSSF